MAELFPIAKAERKPMCFLYSDGGPDHRLTYISVQLSLISLFLQLDLDYLCAVRTAPFHIWRSPVERIMSIINLGLQSVGLARKEMEQDYERLASKASSMKDFQKFAEKEPGFHEFEAALDSIAYVKLQLKGRDFQIFLAASDQELETFSGSILLVDESLRIPSINKAQIGQYPQLEAFIQHCCR